MKILVDPKVTPRGFGLGDDNDELCILSGCCVARLESGNSGDRDCSSCKKTVVEGRAMKNSGIYWAGWYDQNFSSHSHSLRVLHGWLAEWFGYSLDEFEIVIEKSE